MMNERPNSKMTIPYSMPHNKNEIRGGVAGGAGGAAAPPIFWDSGNMTEDPCKNVV